MKSLEKLLLVKKTNTQLVAFVIIHTSKKNYNLIAMNFSKEQSLDADPKAI